MSLRADIQLAQTEAMKNRDAERTSVLRMLWAAIRNEEINAQHELSDEETLAVVSRQVKQLEDATRDFESGNRQDLVEKTKKEIDMLRAYLPAQLSDSELESRVRAVLANMGAVTPADFGKAMGAVMKDVKGQADGNRVREMLGRVMKQT